MGGLPPKEPETGPEVSPGSPGQARLLATGTLLQQLAQGSGLVVLFVIVTLLARRLSVAELGAYGLLSSLAGYLLVLRNSVASSAVRSMSGAADASARARAFSTAAALYVAVAVATGLIVAGVGALLAEAILSGDLEGEGRNGSLLLGAVIAAGIAASIYLDALRSSLLLPRAAATEIVGVALHLGVMLALILADASLTVLIGASGGMMLMSGVLSAVQVRALRLPYRFRRGEVSRSRARELARVGGYLLVVELSNLVIYALDRVILGVFRSATTVGLYEGPVRTHNLFYALSNALAVTSLPAASRYAAAGDAARLRALVVRGSRYTLALFVPLAVTAIALSGPLLEVWLGERYREGEVALALLVSYWILYGALAVTPGFLVGAGRAREAARYMAGVAALNLGLSLALTPLLGLEGPALGTAIAFALAFPFLVRLGLSAADVRLAELAREAWLPAYSLGAALAAVLVALRLAFGLDDLGPFLAVAIGGLAAYWAAFYVGFLSSEERRLVREVVRGSTSKFDVE
jgi:O-antigen/teichoic acid export membrane protein